jgi:glyoxylase-like metal-dependent hydrolase (beta-lactamase superfamily II)
VLHTPGHTCGSVCYIIGDCIFTGDTLFEGTIGRTDFPTGDNNALMLSLGKLKELRGDYKIYAGHGLATTLGREKRINPYML